MSKAIINFECPKCHCGAKAELETIYKFLIYKCPNCHSNVAYYNNKLAVISDRMINILRKKNKLKFCRANFKADSSSKSFSEKFSEDITPDRITDLKIILETEKDFNKLLAKL